jgi:hypothetical protein
LPLSIRRVASVESTLAGGRVASETFLGAPKKKENILEGSKKVRKEESKVGYN